MDKNKTQIQKTKNMPLIWACITAIITFCCCVFVSILSYQNLAKEELKNTQISISNIATNNPDSWKEHPQTLAALLSDNKNIIHYIETPTGEYIPNSGQLNTSGIHIKLPLYTPDGLKGFIHSYYDYKILFSNMWLFLLCSFIFAAFAYAFLKYTCSEVEKIINKIDGKRLQAETANAAKNSFLAHVSHELRTPINGITSLNDLLMKTELSYEQQELTHLMKGSGRILLSVANDLLDITRLESQGLTIENRQINLERIIEDIGILMATDANERGLQLFISYDPNLPSMYISDASRIRQIVMNLVSNAIKFTHLGHVCLTVERSPITLNQSDNMIAVRIKVEDTGVGLDPVEKQELESSLMDMPYKANRNLESHAGLGLTIVHQVTQLLGGVLTIDSAVGKGSSFTVDLPLQEDVAHQRAQNQTSPFENLKVLLIDDHPIHRDIILGHLNAWHAQVTFTTEEHAVKQLKEAKDAGKPFDVTLFHESIQQASGMRFARTVKTEASLKDEKLILIADRKQLYLNNESVHKSFSILIGKPVRPSELYDALFSISNNSQSLETTIKSNNQLAEKLSKKITALLVEDNHLSQQVAKLNLEVLGCEVDVANNGEKALHQVRQKDYDIIFMDCHMPVMNGFDTTERIRKLEREGYVKATPIIAITAEALIGDRERCMQAGMDGYISKPYVQQDLRDAIEMWAIHSERRIEKPETGETTEAPQKHEKTNDLDATKLNS